MPQLAQVCRIFIVYELNQAHPFFSLQCVHVHRYRFLVPLSSVKIINNLTVRDLHHAIGCYILSASHRTRHDRVPTR